MSNVWREEADPEKHSDFMSTYRPGGITVEKSKDNLIKKWVYFAKISDFTFQFASLDQVKECKDFFENKVHPSTADSYNKLERFWHSWYCKLPKGMLKDSKRQKVLKALEMILDTWE